VCRADFEAAYAQGQQSAAVAGRAKASAAASRTHLLCFVTVERRRGEGGAATSGQLTLVDLAGSERKSTASLEAVLGALADSRRPAVPYRDSKLTRWDRGGAGLHMYTCTAHAVVACTYVLM
jgi:hypothetical protein